MRSISRLRKPSRARQQAVAPETWTLTAQTRCWPRGVEGAGHGSGAILVWLARHSGEDSRLGGQCWYDRRDACPPFVVSNQAGPLLLAMGRDSTRSTSSLSDLGLRESRYLYFDRLLQQNRTELCSKPKNLA